MAELETVRLELSMDRLDCIARELLRIIDTKQFSKAILQINESNIQIIPVAEPIKIVLKREIDIA